MGTTYMLRGSPFSGSIISVVAHTSGEKNKFRDLGLLCTPLQDLVGLCDSVTVASRSNLNGLKSSVEGEEIGRKGAEALQIVNLSAKDFSYFIFKPVYGIRLSQRTHPSVAGRLFRGHHFDNVLAMPIAQLSDETTRFLRSTIVLNNASTVIKELIDNALDSYATIISIEISANALDVLQVRDNGVGIGIEDRQLLCKRGCTSKIRTLHDLEVLGGQYLGFRGEALSSIADISEHVFITTRVKDEAAGTSIKFGPKGKLLSSVSASHHVGTTVRVQNFLSNVPVRKQTAIKESNKVLVNVKRLLLAYAFVRPMVRFSLKVLKREQDKSNWSFAPDETSKQLSITATKIVGKEVATKCETYSTAVTTPDDDVYSVDALLIAPDASEPKAGSPNQFLAIDRRPVSAERGIMKQISKIYRAYLQESASKDLKIPSKPFLVLQIACPQGSYDVNIEPAKDEVLFHKPDVVLELAHKLFSEVYGETSITSQSSLPPQATSSLEETSTPAFDLLLARRKPEVGDAMGELHQRSVLNRTEPIGASTPEYPNQPAETVRNPISVQRVNLTQAYQSLSNMYDMEDDDDDGDTAGITRAEDTPIQSIRGDVEYDAPELLGQNIRNPFTTAALHARIRPRNMTADIEAVEESSTTTGSTSMANGVLCSPARIALRPSADLQYLPTPSKSPERGQPYQNPGPPIPRRTRRGSSDGVEEDQLEDDPVIPSIRPQQRLMQSWIQSSPIYHESSRHLDPSSAFHRNGTVSRPIEAQQHETRGTADTVVSTQRARISPSQQPFKMPLKKSIQHNVDVGSLGEGHSSHQELSESSELDQIMDFEHRKKAVNQQLRLMQPRLNPADLALLQRESMASEPTTGSSFPHKNNIFMPNRATDHSSQSLFPDVLSQKVSQTSSPHRNRYEAAIRNLESRDKSDLSKGETRGDTIRTDKESQMESSLSSRIHTWPRPVIDPQGSQADISSSQHALHPKSTSQRRKAKISRPPLESIPVEAQKYNVVCIPREPFPDLPNLSQTLQTLNQHDPYIQTGKIHNVDWNPFSQRTQIWQTSLESLIRETFRAPSFIRERGSDAASPPANSPAAPGNTHTHIDPVTPTVNVNLTQSIKSHLRMLDEQHGLQQTQPSTQKDTSEPDI